MYSPKHGVALAIIAKSGSQSFCNASPSWYISNEQALLYPLRVLFIRYYLERLYSNYSFFKGLAISGSKYNNNLVTFTDTYESFVDYVLLNEHNDEHFLPQVESVRYRGQLTANLILRFEDVNEWWPNFFTGKLERLNSAPRLSEIDPNYRRSEIDAYYANDANAWNSARKFQRGRDEGLWPLL